MTDKPDAAKMCPTSHEFEVELSGELVRHLCMRVCDDVAGISEWDGDPRDTEHRYKAGVVNTCEEIKYRIASMDLTKSMAAAAPIPILDAAPSAATPAQISFVPEHLRAAHAVSAAPDDVAALIAELEACGYVAGRRAIDPLVDRAAAMLRRLSAPAGDLPESDFPRIAALLAKYGQLSLGQAMERIEAAELLAQQRGERVAELEKGAARYAAALQLVRRIRLRDEVHLGLERWSGIDQDCIVCICAAALHIAGDKPEANAFHERIAAIDAALAPAAPDGAAQLEQSP